VNRLAQRDVVERVGGWEAFVALEDKDRWQRLFEREAYYHEQISRDGLARLRLVAQRG
jgi:hypothetical protein